jgi:ribosomal protein S27AE
MDDPLQRSSRGPAAATDAGGGSSLFTSTSRLAGEKAAKLIGSRRAKILQLLGQRPMALFEVAETLGVFDHQISGRFTELAADGLIEHAGERRIKPGTDCQCEVWRLRPTSTPAPVVQELLGYPSEIRVKVGGKDEGAFGRQVLTEHEQFPGIPYACQERDRLSIVWRIEFVECPRCGKPLKFIQEKEKKLFRCGKCPHTYELATVQEPGQPQLLALLLRTL